MRARVLTLAIVGCAVAGVGALAWYGYQHGSFGLSDAALLQRLPTQEGVVVSIDFDKLRRAGLLQKLAPQKSQEEPEYSAFVRESGLDYQRDLDRALVSFTPEGTFFLIRGRFDWAKLQGYARGKGGSCFSDLCRMAGSQPERRISYLPLNKHLMALAVSPDDFAASRLQKAGIQRAIQAPGDPVWISIPAVAWQRGGGLPAGAKLFVSAIAGAEQVMVTVGPHQDAIEARLEATCHSAQQATALAVQLQKATITLRDLLAQQKAPQRPDELGALLTSGVFSQDGAKVTGRWPVRQAFLDNMLAGI